MLAPRNTSTVICSRNVGPTKYVYCDVEQSEATTNGIPGDDERRVKSLSQMATGAKIYQTTVEKEKDDDDDDGEDDDKHIPRIALQ